MPSPVVSVEHEASTAVVHLKGDVVADVASLFYGRLRMECRRRDVGKLVIDFAEAGRLDSAGVAVLSMVGQQAARAGKELDLENLAPHHRAALALAPKEHVAPARIEHPGAVERLGSSVLGTADSARALVGLIAETLRQAVAVIARKRRLPEGAVLTQIATMGVDAFFIVSLLSFLIGMTVAFQASVQLQRFGASVYVADLVGLSVVRELAPLMTAVVLTGRTGAAIAAELGTMRVRSEIDALSTMGINPVRFLVLPRIASVTFTVPALTLMAMFIGMAGGLLVATTTLHVSAITFWHRMLSEVELEDYQHGLSKSFVFAWIIGFAGTHLGLRAHGDAASVGAATTRTVVASIFFIICVDAIFATVSTSLRYP